MRYLFIEKMYHYVFNRCLHYQFQQSIRDSADEKYYKMSVSAETIETHMLLLMNIYNVPED